MKKIPPFFSLLSLLWLLIVNNSFAEDMPNKTYQQAEQYFQQNEPIETLDFPREFYQQGEQLLKKNNHFKALSVIDEFITKNSSEKAYILRRKIHIQLGQINNVIDDYQQLIRLKPHVAIYYGNLGWLYLKQGEFSKAQEMSLKAYELDRSNYAWVAILGHCYFLQDDNKNADKYYQQALSLLETSEQLEKGLLADFALFIKNDWKIEEDKKKRDWFIANFSSNQIEASRLNKQGIEFHQVGQYPQAELALLKAIELRKKLLGENNPLTLTSNNNLAMLYYDQGRYELAEPLLKETLQLRKEVLGDKHSDTLVSMGNLGQLYQDQGRYKQAEPLLRKAAVSTDDLIGNPLTNPRTSVSMNNLGHLYQDQGKYKIAELLLTFSLFLQKPQMEVSLLTIPKLQKGILNDKVFNDKNPYTLSILSNLAELYAEQGLYEQAEPLLKDTLMLRKEVLGEKHPDTLTSMNNLAMLYYGYEQGEPLLKDTLRLRKEVLGKTHPDTLMTMSNLALLYKDQERYKEALSLIRQVNDYYKNTLPKLVDDKANTALISQTNSKGNFMFHVGLINDLQQQSNTTQDLTGEAFEYAQLAQNPVDAQVVTQMALTYAANDPKTKTLVERIRDAVAYRNQLSQKMVIALSSKDTTTDSRLKTSIDMQANIDKNEAVIKQLDSELKSSFPAYSQIINPAPIPLSEIQKTLAKDEALLVYLLAEEDNYVFMVKHDKAVLRRLPVGKYNGLEERVNELRCAFYLTCEDGKPLQPPASGQMPEPFDIQLANGLYQDLIAPIEAELTNTKHLITVADGALHSLPFQILVKSITPNMPKIGKYDLSQYKQVDWLIKHYSFSSLPSVKSLSVLRDKHKKVSTAKQPFIGFGDPEFQGKTGNSKDMTIESLFRAAGDEKQSYLIDLPRLKNTATELKKLAKSLDYFQSLPEFILKIAERWGWIKQSIYLQQQASESEVKKLSDSKKLATQVLAFSTHALLAHESSRFHLPAEAGLALPEKNINSKNDGLLTGSEISRLNLNADWVVLSACNTATLEKNTEASGLSELAKSFFLKGSRSLLASHWYVDSATTEYLLTNTFERLKRNPQLPRAQALRQSMLSLIENSDKKFAHPLYWAPFVIMGEGGI